MISTVRIAAAALALVAGVGALAVPAAGQAAAAAKPTPDALDDPAFQAPAVLDFMGLKAGGRVADIASGSFARALSQRVGPTGIVYAVEPVEVTSHHPKMLAHAQQLGTVPATANVRVVAGPIDAVTLPSGLDAVFIRQNYHDLHDKFMGPADVAALNRRVFNALKPGGVYVILDHAAAAGSGLRDTDTLHRIDPAAVRAEVTAAGFVFDGASTAFANPADPHEKAVFDPAVRGHTDQFLFRFRKPG